MNAKILSALCLLVVAATAHALPAPDWAKERYEHLSSPAFRVEQSENGRPIVGSQTTQKNDPDGGFCRMIRAMAPGAPATYACYSIVANLADAEELYTSSTAEEMRVLFYTDQHPLVGRRWSEKVVTGSRYGDSILCVKTSPVTPLPVPSYTCYADRQPVGGGISVGN